MDQGKAQDQSPEDEGLLACLAQAQLSEQGVLDGPLSAVLVAGFWGADRL